MPRESSSRNIRVVRVSGSSRNTVVVPPEVHRPYNFRKYAPASHFFLSGVFEADVDLVRKDFKRLLDFAFAIDTDTTEEDLTNLLFHLKQRVDYWEEAQDYWDEEDEEVYGHDYDSELYMVRRHLRRHLGELEAQIPSVQQWLQYKIDQRLPPTVTANVEDERRSSARRRYVDTASFSRFFPS
jgi:hypothetical protein